MVPSRSSYESRSPNPPCPNQNITRISRPFCWSVIRNETYCSRNKIWWGRKRSCLRPHCYAAKKLPSPAAIGSICGIRRYSAPSRSFEKAFYGSTSTATLHAHLLANLVIGEAFSSQFCGSALTVCRALRTWSAHLRNSSSVVRTSGMCIKVYNTNIEICKSYSLNQNMKWYLQ